MLDLTKPTLAWSLPWDADWVTAVAFLGPNRIAAGNTNGTILVWDLPEKPGGDAPRPVVRFDGHTNHITHLAATPDGKTLISSSYDHTIRYWNAAATAEPTETIALNAQTIADLKRRSASKIPAPIEAKVGVVPSTRTLDAHKEWVVGLELSRDGKSLISGDDGGQVIIWDREAGTITRRWQVKGWAYGVALSPDRKQACIGERVPLVFDSGRHVALKLWDATTGTMTRDLSADFKGHIIAAAAYSADGKTLAIARGGEIDGTNGIVTLLDPATGKKIRDLAPGHLNGATDLAFHPDGKHIASCGRDTVVRIWDVATGKLVVEVGKPRGGQFKDWIHAISFTADGSRLAAADMAGAVQLWTFPT